MTNSTDTDMDFEHCKKMMEQTRSAGMVTLYGCNLDVLICALALASKIQAGEFNITMQESIECYECLPSDLIDENSEDSCVNFNDIEEVYKAMTQELIKQTKEELGLWTKNREGVTADE